MEKIIYLTTKQAMDLYEEKIGSTITGTTFRVWCHKYNFAIKVGGYWHVDKEKYLSFLSGDFRF